MGNCCLPYLSFPLSILLSSVHSPFLFPFSFPLSILLSSVHSPFLCPFSFPLSVPCPVGWGRLHSQSYSDPRPHTVSCHRLWSISHQSPGPLRVLLCLSHYIHHLHPSPIFSVTFINACTFLVLTQLYRTNFTIPPSSPPPPSPPPPFPSSFFFFFFYIYMSDLFISTAVHFASLKLTCIPVDNGLPPCTVAIALSRDHGGVNHSLQLGCVTTFRVSSCLTERKKNLP